mmetsp:Transcript_19235/g.38276  ORF Transcript_19235/g.38276 Transcript_19235/m.38276 type:complete len:109 (+) Transcript_19235:710-1036(+)
MMADRIFLTMAAENLANAMEYFPVTATKIFRTNKNFTTMKEIFMSVTDIITMVATDDYTTAQKISTIATASFLTNKRAAYISILINMTVDITWTNIDPLNFFLQGRKH